MYARDMPLIARHALATPAGLVDVITFVLTSIRVPFSSVAQQMRCIKSHGVHAKALWGHKRAGYKYARIHQVSLHAAVVAAVRNQDAVFAIDCLALVPGLGIPKAAFVAQLCGLDVACLDIHNLRRLGMSAKDVRFSKNTSETLRRSRISSYVKLTQDTGGAEFWWDTWCAAIAGNRYNKSLATADAVSAHHVECICQDQQTRVAAST